MGPAQFDLYGVKPGKSTKNHQCMLVLNAEVSTPLENSFNDYVFQLLLHRRDSLTASLNVVIKELKGEICVLLHIQACPSIIVHKRFAVSTED